MIDVIEAVLRTPALVPSTTSEASDGAEEVAAVIVVIETEVMEIAAIVTESSEADDVPQRSLVDTGEAEEIDIGEKIEIEKDDIQKEEEEEEEEGGEAVEMHDAEEDSEEDATMM